MIVKRRRPNAFASSSICLYTRTKQRFVIWKSGSYATANFCVWCKVFCVILAQWQFINIFAITCPIGALHREIRRRYLRQSIILIVIITTVFIRNSFWRLYPIKRIAKVLSCLFRCLFCQMPAKLIFKHTQRTSCISYHFDLSYFGRLAVPAVLNM